MKDNLGPAEGAGDNRFDKLSRMMIGRYHAQFPRYKEKTLDLLALVSRGKTNGYAAIETKSDAVNSSTGDERNYLRTITGAFTIKVGVDANGIVKSICDARARYGYERFKGNVHKQCVEEFYRVFIVREVMLPGADGKNYRAYIPMFALLVD
jgi:hypothetical protein